MSDIRMILVFLSIVFLSIVIIMIIHIVMLYIKQDSSEQSDVYISRANKI